MRLNSFLEERAAGLAAAALFAVVALCFGAWILLRIQSYIVGRTPESARDAPFLPDGDESVGCPVLFTEDPGFRGERRCFQLGAYEDLSGDVGIAQVQSFSVRRGYAVRCFREPHYKGEVLLRVGGPTARDLEDRKAFPFPKSMVVGFRGAVASV